MSEKKLSAEQLDELTKLAALPDDEIDTKGIPEAPAENGVTNSIGRSSSR